MARTVDLRLLGPFRVHRGGTPWPLPSSRKVRALIAYLALTPRGVTRAHLCELLWDLPQDPRGELRWCLSKARRVLDEPHVPRVQSVDDAIRLDLPDGSVDALSVDKAFSSDITTLDRAALSMLAARFTGDFLEGLEIERSPHFSAWLLAQRRHFRACNLALLEQLVARCGNDETALAIPHLEQWLVLAPLDQRAHALMLAALAQTGRMQEGEEHLAHACRLFDSEGMDWRVLGMAWRAAQPPRPDDHSGAGAHLPVVLEAQPQLASVLPRVPPGSPHRASIAVMPFGELPSTEPHQNARPLGAGFAHDLITRLSRLRNLFVFAQGTMFTLHGRSIGAQEAARTLDAKYAVGGSIRRRGDQVTVDVELIETRSARVLWAATLERTLDDALQVLGDIGDGIIASVDAEIEAAERDRAILIQNPASLDAWEAHHRGLWHMYRFNQADNAQARHWFEVAVRLDPGFSRAFAGLSFTYWQDAFQHWGEHRLAAERAYRTASQGLRADERDPAAHWALGRALWLRGQHVHALAELESAVEISPSFALGHYTLAFVHSQSGDPAAAIAYADHSRHLSPFDPLLFGMLGARALALVRQGHFDAAAHWGLQAAERPNAHVHIQAIGVLTLALAGRLEEAHALVNRIRAVTPAYRLDHFLAAFHFAPPDAEVYRCVGEASGLA